MATVPGIRCTCGHPSGSHRDGTGACGVAICKCGAWNPHGTRRRSRSILGGEAMTGIRDRDMVAR
jgi:hypothetical protein